ncbi:hypothetical protein OROHE_023879 [Orobanche hederae]
MRALDIHMMEFLIYQIMQRCCKSRAVLFNPMSEEEC